MAGNYYLRLDIRRVGPMLHKDRCTGRR